MKKILTEFFVLVFCIVILTGCWDRRELNDLAIATALGIDKSEEGYLVTIQLINAGEIGNDKTSNNALVNTYKSSGKTVFEALRKLTLEAPRRIFIAHLRLIVFGEELAREDGIRKAIEFISRDHETRTEFYFLIAKNATAEELLNILTPLEEIPTNRIISGLETSKRVWGSTHPVQLDEMVSNIASQGKETVLTGAIIKGNPEVGMDTGNLEKVDIPTVIKLQHLAAFRKDKLIGWLSEEESIGYNHIMGEIKSTIVTFPWREEEKISVEVIRTRVKVKGKLEHGEPKIEIEYRVEGNIGDVEPTIDLLDEKNIQEIEELVAEEIKKQMEVSIEKAKELKSDIFGFGQVIHRAEPKVWKELKNDWSRKFEELEVDIKVSSKIRLLGTILEPYNNEIGE